MFSQRPPVPERFKAENCPALQEVWRLQGWQMADACFIVRVSNTAQVFDSTGTENFSICR